MVRHRTQHRVTATRKKSAAYCSMAGAGPGVHNTHARRLCLVAWAVRVSQLDQSGVSATWMHIMLCTSTVDWRVGSPRHTQATRRHVRPLHGMLQTPCAHRRSGPGARGGYIRASGDTSGRTSGYASGYTVIVCTSAASDSIANSSKLTTRKAIPATTPPSGGATR